MPLKFSVLTLFPRQVHEALGHSITGRALAKGLLELETLDIRQFAVNDYGQVDDAPYGGGRGMVMRCEPVYDAWKAAGGDQEGARTLYLSPAGPVFNFQKARELASETRLILLCGHYEGVDRRVLDEIHAEELSIGDFVLTGGELAAAVVIDAVSRLLPGVLPDQEAWEKDSFSDGMLEWPQYTRPAIWQGREVPAVYCSGHQARIDRERELDQLLETLRKRPELLRDQVIDPLLWELLGERLGAGSGQISE